MEREKRKKRGREGERRRESKRAAAATAAAAKKQEPPCYADDTDNYNKEINSTSTSTSNSSRTRRLCEEPGVFDFPWLKEGATMITDDESYLKDLQEDTFAPSSYLCEPLISTAPIIDCPDQCCLQNCQNNNRSEHKDPLTNRVDGGELEDELLSLKARFDEVDPLDCVWGSLLDQPLDVSLNKV